MHFKILAAARHRLIILPVLVLGGMVSCSGQVTLLKESFGNSGGTVSLDQHILNQGFDNDGLDFGSGDADNASDIRISSPSFGYTQENGDTASGGSNVWFSASGERGFSVSGLRAGSFDSLELWFAYRKENASSNASFAVQWSPDGAQWNTLTLSGLPTAGAGTGWYLIGPVVLPDSAHSNGLHLRWIKSSGALRIDDVLLFGEVNHPFLSATVASLTGFTGYEDLGASSTLQLEINAFAIPSGDSLYLETAAPFEMSFDSMNFFRELSEAGTGSDMNRSLWVRVSEGQERGAFSGELVLRANGADSILVPLEGSVFYAGEQTLEWAMGSDTAADGQVGIERPVLRQGNNHGTTTFLSSASASDNYTGASGGNNGAMAVKTGTLNISTSSYVSWTVTPDSLKTIRLLGIAFGSRSTSSGPVYYSLRSGTDSFGSEICGGGLLANSQWAHYSSEMESPEISERTEFRLYVYGGSGTASINIANWRLDDLRIQFRVWNLPGSSAFRSNGSGSFSDSALWNYAYYDTLYKAANRPPGAYSAIHIRSGDSLVLDGNWQGTGNLTVDGILTLNGKQLELSGNLGGNGCLYGDSEAQLSLGGAGNNILRMSQATNGVSNSLRTLRLDSDSGLLLELPLRINQWVDVRKGSLVSGGRLYLMASGQGYAQVLPEGKGGIKGSLCMQMTIPGATAGWRAFYSPFDTVSIGQLGGQLELHTSNSAPSGDNRNVYTWDEAQAAWELVTDPAFSLHDRAVNMYVFETGTTTLQLCGLYDTAAHSFGTPGFHSGTPQTEGWHLIGNPFPSSINWNSIEKPTGMNGNYAIWSEEDGNYRPWNGSTGSAGNLIPPMHGFWIKVNSTLNEDFIIKQQDRDTSQVNHFGKKSAFGFHLRITVNALKGSYRDECILYSGDGSTEPVNAPKLAGKKEAPYLAIGAEGKEWSILHWDSTERVPVHFHAEQAGTYQFMLEPEGKGTSTWSLVDQKLGTRVALDKAGSYSFPYSPDEESAGRFFLETSQPLSEPSITENDIVCTRSGDFLTVVSRGPIESVDIYTSSGQLIHSASPSFSGSLYIPVGSYPSAVYLVNVKTDKAVYSRLIALP